MKLHGIVVVTAIALFAPPGAFAQEWAKPQSPYPPTSAPTAFAGFASSAVHCVAGNAANVHALGWVERGSRVHVMFESNFNPSAAVVSLDLQGNQAEQWFDDDSGVGLDPELHILASSSGTLALHVVGVGNESGCYRYKLEIDPPARSAYSVAAARPLTIDRDTSAPSAITGPASSARHCVVGRVANVHSVGRIESGNTITVSFSADFDAIAGLALVDFNSGEARLAVDNDSGGSRVPLLRVAASQGGTVALYVSSVDGGAGCYSYKVEMQRPSSSAASETPGAWRLIAAGRQ